MNIVLFMFLLLTEKLIAFTENRIGANQIFHSSGSQAPPPLYDSQSSSFGQIYISRSFYFQPTKTQWYVILVLS